MLSHVEGDEKVKWWKSIEDGPMTLAIGLLDEAQHSYEVTVPDGAPSPFVAVYHEDAETNHYFEIKHTGWQAGRVYLLTQERLEASYVERSAEKHAEIVESGERFATVTKASAKRHDALDDAHVLANFLNGVAEVAKRHGAEHFPSRYARTIATAAHKYLVRSLCSNESRALSFHGARRCVASIAQRAHNRPCSPSPDRRHRRPLAPAGCDAERRRWGVAAHGRRSAGAHRRASLHRYGAHRR